VTVIGTLSSASYFVACSTLDHHPADGTHGPMGLGSIGGAMLGAMLLPYAPSSALKLILGVILIGSAIKIFRHQRSTASLP